METAALIDAIPCLAGLAAKPRARLEAAARCHAWSAGETGAALEQGGWVLFVTAGHLRVSALAAGRVSFQDLKAGDAFGLDHAVAGEGVPARALLAVEPSEGLAVQAEALLAVLKASAPAALAVAAHLAGRLLSAGTVAPGPLQLVYRELLRAARPAGPSCWTLDPMPRHRELAARSGVAEDDAAAAIAHLVRLGVARRRYPALDIEDREALGRLAESA